MHEHRWTIISGPARWFFKCHLTWHESCERDCSHLTIDSWPSFDLFNPWTWPNNSPTVSLINTNALYWMDYSYFLMAMYPYIPLKRKPCFFHFSPSAGFGLGPESVFVLLSLRIFLILPFITLLMCVIMSTTSAVTPTVLHQCSTQTCALPTQPNPSAINPSLRSHPRQKPKSHKSS